MQWDYLVKQSDNIDQYNKSLATLQSQQVLYRCSCNRKRLKQLNGCYDDHCRKLSISETQPASVRFRNDAPAYYHDYLYGEQHFSHRQLGGDFIVKRRDGIIGYHLASVTDDINYRVSRVIRGSDLMQSTARQILLFKSLGYTPPTIWHTPIITDANGFKLSKQAQAPELEISKTAAPKNLHNALKLLGQHPPDNLYTTSIKNIWQWSIANWDLEKLNIVCTQNSIPLSTL